VGVGAGTDSAPPATAEQQKNANLEPVDADGFSRRGTALAARRDFAHAIADLTRACEMAPQEANYFYERALAYWANKQGALAMADLDRAIELKPGDVKVLTARADLRLRGHQIAGAVSDLDAADHAAARESDARLAIGSYYSQADRLTEAISQYNLWIDAHGDDPRLVTALNSRCWARAMSGQDLDKGLGDCNKAVRLSSDSPICLNTRALIRLRMGDFDRSIADYDTVLKQRPSYAAALYGRGLARLRKHQTDAGNNDMTAAVALRPHIADVFKSHGLSP